MIDLIDETNVVVFGTNLPQEFFEVLDDYVVPKTFINYSTYDSNLDYPADTQFIDSNGDIYTVGADGSVTVTANLADAAATSLLADVYLKYSSYDANETYPAGTQFLDEDGNIYTIAADGTVALTGSMLSDTAGVDDVYLKYSTYDSAVSYPPGTQFLDENGDIYTILNDGDGTLELTGSMLTDATGVDDVYLRYDSYDANATYPAGTKFLDDNGDVYEIAADGSISLTGSVAGAATDTSSLAPVDQVYLRYDSYDSAVTYPVGTEFLDTNGDVYTIAADGSISLTSSLPVASGGGTAATDAPSAQVLFVLSGNNGRNIEEGGYGFNIGTFYGGTEFVTDANDDLVYGNYLLIPKTGIYGVNVSFKLRWIDSTTPPSVPVDSFEYFSLPCIVVQAKTTSGTISPIHHGYLSDFETNKSTLHIGGKTLIECQEGDLLYIDVLRTNDDGTQITMDGLNYPVTVTFHSDLPL